MLTSQKQRIAQAKNDMVNYFPKLPHVRTILMAGSILALTLTATVTFFFHRTTRRPVAAALIVARKSPDFQRAIGEPFHVRFMSTGTVLEKDGNGNADLTIPVSGPRGKGRLFEWAQEANGKWHLCSLSFQQDNSPKGVTLVNDANTLCERE